MKVSSLIGTVVEMITKVIVAVLVVYFLYRGAMACYDYGYRIFTEPAISTGEGRMVTVTVKEEMSPLDMGELFVEKGLVRDAKLFAIQYILSEYREDFRPGTYELTTAMTTEEMMEVMGTHEEEETEDK